MTTDDFIRLLEGLDRISEAETKAKNDHKSAVQKFVIASTSSVSPESAVSTFKQVVRANEILAEQTKALDFLQDKFQGLIKASMRNEPGVAEKAIKTLIEKLSTDKQPSEQKLTAARKKNDRYEKYLEEIAKMRRGNNAKGEGKKSKKGPKKGPPVVTP